MRTVEGLVTLYGAACFERLSCPSCRYDTTYLHPFIERVLCASCGHAIPSNIPRLPSPGEPIAVDYEQAIQDLSRTDKGAALYIRDLASSIACDRV